MAHHIQNLISQGEHQHLDFKYAISDARHIAESFSAFANAGGGKLLIGVRDNGTISGVRTDEEMYMVDAAAAHYCTPPVGYSVRRWQCQGKTVLEVDIPEGADKPYLAKRKDKPPAAYVRIADRDVKASVIQLMVWEKQKNPSGLVITDTEHVKRLMSQLEKQPCITISAACKLLIFSYKKALRLVADLVYLNILEIEYQNDKVLLRTKK